jgi:hypothetical protein
MLMGGDVPGGVGAHGPELVDLEQLAPLANPLLLEKHRPRRIELHQQGEKGEERRGDPAGGRHQEKVHQAFECRIMH